MRALLVLIALAGIAHADDDALTNRAHFLGVRGNIGSSYEAGLGYIHAFETRGAGGHFWWGVGPDVRLTLDGDGIAGVTGLAILRTAFVGHGIPTGFELGLGAGRGVERTGGDTRVVGTAAMFVTFYFGDLGYEYQLALAPFDRPAWLGAHFFAIRGHIPLHRF